MCRMTGILETCTLMWLFIGSIWLLSCRTCSIDAPIIYWTSFVWIAYGYLITCLPLIFFTIFICVLPTAILISKSVKAKRKQKLAKQALAKLPVMTYAEATGEFGKSSVLSVASSDDCCAVCLSGYGRTQPVRKLACLHYFHQRCADQWLVSHFTCPLCMKSII